jgi:hypothetical protein
MGAATDQWVEFTGEGRRSGLEELIARRDQQLVRLKALHAAATTTERTREAVDRAVSNLTGKPFDEAAFKRKHRKRAATRVAKAG